MTGAGEGRAGGVRAGVAANPGLRNISVIGHSRGGRLAHYAVGALFSPRDGTGCGLAPRHFVTLATPHMGCDAEGLAQVPFIGWSAGIPLVGGPVAQLLQRVSVPVASAFLGRTGAQFFLADAAGGAGGGAAAQPLLVQMTRDVPERGARGGAWPWRWAPGLPAAVGAAGGPDSGPCPVSSDGASAAGASGRTGSSGACGCR